MPHLQVHFSPAAARGMQAARAGSRAWRPSPPAPCLPRARVLPFAPRQHRPRQAVRLHALPKLGSIFKAGQLAAAVDGVWKKYDVDDDGCLSLDEATALLNSPELGDFMQKNTNVRPPHRSREEVAGLFQAADTNKDKKLSRTEFVAMYLKIIAQRVKSEPKVLLQVLLGAIDWNRDGSINGTELKRLLRLAGIPFVATAPIPDGVNLNYSKVTSLLGLPPPEPKAEADAAPKPPAAPQA